MAWFEPQICISYHGLKAVRVFADQAPFQEQEPVQIEDMEDPCSMAASAKSHAIYISESKAKRIWKLNLPNKIPKLLMFQSGNPGQLSVTPKNELLVVVESPYKGSKNDTGVDNPLGDQRHYFSIELFQLKMIVRKRQFLFHCTSTMLDVRSNYRTRTSSYLIRTVSL